MIEHNVPLDGVVRTGEIINADVNQRLIENIFFKNSPLHDGAMVISKKRIKAAGCILPVSHNLDIPKELGFVIVLQWEITESDAHAIIVSEETDRFLLLIRAVLSSFECRRAGKFINEEILKIIDNIMTDEIL